ncbi:DUF885 domain-containing protein [Actinomyces faecalis]|uniref:DUF885 domain-containing protein n=1 Tax=Actinomyces faecalis TaxID=2722820 RepID=UPI0015528C78|nr:DUF885 domain-containing protein [Actinomyces faecalis]
MARKRGQTAATAAALTELTAIAEQAARLEAAYDPAAARAAGLPQRQDAPPLPLLAPGVLADKARAQRELARRARQVSWRTLETTASDRHTGADLLGEQTRARVLRNHLIDRLETSSQMIELGEDSAHLGNLTSSFQRLRRELVRAVNQAGTGQEDQEHADRVLEALPQALEALGDGLRSSARAGVVAPRSQVLLVAGQVDALADERGPLRTVIEPDTAPVERRRRLGRAVSRARQAADALASLMRHQIAPVASTREGVGPERHRLWVRRLLGTEVEPVQICEWARQELRAVTARQDALAREVLGPGAGNRLGEAASAYDSYLRAEPERGLRPQDFVPWAQEVADEAWERLVGPVVSAPSSLGRAKVELDAPGGGVHYDEPEPRAGSPGRMLRSLAAGDEVLWPWAERTTVLHETTPGHHIHSGAQSVDPRLTVWQRHLARVPGCNEGWGLYAEALAVEHGLIWRPEEVFGWLAARRWRVARILVDLGIHCWLPVPPEVAALPGASGAPRWDRATAQAVLRAHTVLGEGFLHFEVDKQLGWPAQGLSYVLGERVWLSGREVALRRLRGRGVSEGQALRDFHDRAIALGSVGLDLLERELGETAPLPGSS